VSLKGKFALITGSSRGIGRGIALKLAEKGAKVAVHYYQNEAAARETLAKIKERGSDGFTVQADVRRPHDINRMFKQVKDDFGALDVFVSNARGEVSTFYRTPLEITLDCWETAVDSQAKALLVGIQEANQLLRQNGRIVAITYTPGGRFGSWQPWVAMGAAKSAMESLCRYFAVALAGRGITVNAVSPGWTESGWTPMGRLGTPADIGNAVALLCSEEAGWITGQVIAADGGSSLMESALPLEIQQAARKATKSEAA